MKALFRLASAGSVDDGKSTLIGRLLLETDSLFEDQLLEIDKASAQSGSPTRDLAFVTDGLREERARNVTIDVAYRPLRTERRRFILADSPGHAEYARNMVTATSTADLVILLADASRGSRPQTRRHLALAALLGTPVLLAANKMDLVNFREDVFEALCAELTEFGRRLGFTQISAIPISAYRGDNVVTRSKASPWYQGQTLLEFLEGFDPKSLAQIPLNLPIQNVFFSPSGAPIVTGVVIGSILRRGDSLQTPSGERATVKELWVAGERAETSSVGQPVTVQLDGQAKVQRGDWLHRSRESTPRATTFTATLFWMSPSPLQVGRTYLLRQGPRTLNANVTGVVNIIDLDTGDPTSASCVKLNDIAEVEIALESANRLMTYLENHDLGSFILVDGSHTVAAGAIQKIFTSTDDHPASM